MGGNRSPVFGRSTRCKCGKEIRWLEDLPFYPGFTNQRWVHPRNGWYNTNCGVGDDEATPDETSEVIETLNRYEV